jgi:hypothetical protein
LKLSATPFNACINPTLQGGGKEIKLWRALALTIKFAARVLVFEAI